MLNPDALLVAHGQPSDPAPAERALASLAQAVNARLSGYVVGSATLAAPGALERCLDSAGTRPLIYPLFMSDGWFVKTALPRRLQGRNLDVLSPFGLDPCLPALAANAVREQLRERAWEAADTTLLLAAHGSARGAAAAQAATDFVDALQVGLPELRLLPGFIEQSPRLGEVAATLAPPALCLPFFAMAGEHVRCDLPEALDQAGFTVPVLPVLGQLPGTPELIASALQQALSAAAHRSSTMS